MAALRWALEPTPDSGASNRPPFGAGSKSPEENRVQAVGTMSEVVATQLLSNLTNCLAWSMRRNTLVKWHGRRAPAKNRSKLQRSNMKKLIAVLAAIIVAGAVSEVLGQGSPGDTNGPPPPINTNYPGPPPPGWTNPPPPPPPLTWTNTAPPPVWTNRQGRLVPPPSAGEPSHVNPPQAPADVQATIQQFQQSRQALMNQLQPATEAQRQAILGQLEQLREQMRDQLAALRQQAQDQAQQMQDRFGNNRGPVLNQGAPASQGGGPNGGGRPRQ